MSSFRRSPSPPLPTFGIRELSDFSRAPGLISISRSQYDHTIKSQPDAALQYLDDDDGVVVTVGSSLELAQRLEDPVPARIGALSNGSQHGLMHLFDIERSAAVLAEWREHEAYSSKRLRQLDTASFSSSPPSSFAEVHPTMTALPVVSHAHPEPSSPTPDAAVAPVPVVIAETPRSAQNEILHGIETHLNGLANVLQVAADTLRIAADKTRETDTSLVEDILAGVKGILTEVGTLGVEVYKEATRDRADDVSETESVKSEDVQEDESFEEAVEQAILGGIEETVAQVVNDDLDIASIHAEVQSISSIEDLSARNKTHESDNESLTGDLNRDEDAQIRYYSCDHVFYNTEAATNQTRKRLSPDYTASNDPVLRSDQTPEHLKKPVADVDNVSEDNFARNPKVKFAGEEWAVNDRIPSVDQNAPFVTASINSTRPQFPFNAFNEPQAYKPPTLSHPKPPRARELDDVFSFSPASRSILDEPTEDPDFTARYPPLRSIRRAKSTIEPRTASIHKSTFPDASEPRPRPAVNPFSKPAAVPAPLPRPTDRGLDVLDSLCKPLPGAWPDTKPEASTSESSGAFFNRMTGRNNSGLQRSNTTASSNPASRLTGPFDPGFPYHVNSQYQTKRWSTRSLRAPPKLSLSPPDHSLPHRPAAPVAPAAPGYDTRPSNNIPAFKSVYRPYRPDHTQPAMRHHRSVPAFARVANPVPNASIPTWRPTMRSPFVPSPPTVQPDLAQPSVSAQPVLAPKVNFSLPSTAPSVVSAPSQEDIPFRVPGSFDPAPRDAERETVESYPGIGGKTKFDDCVEFLKLCGFGIEDEHLRDRLYVYAVAADGDLETAVEMIEEDRQVSKNLN